MAFSKRQTAVLVFFALLVIVFGTFFRTLWGGFVYDDNVQILKNVWITDIKYIKDVFSNHTFGFSSASYQGSTYRPLFHTVYMLEYALFGLEPWGWHLFNILFHVFNAFFVYLLFSRLLSENGGGKGTFYENIFPPFAGAVIFAVLPVNSEVVSWVGCVPELAYTLLLIAAFSLFASSMEREGKTFYALRAASALVFFAALFVKESAAIFPAMIFVYDWLKRRDEPFISMRKVKAFSPFVAVFVLYILIRMQVLGKFAPARLHTDLTDFELFLNAFPLFLRYLAALVFPAGDYPLQLLDPVTSVFESRFIISALAAALILFSIIFFRKRLLPLHYLAFAFFTPLLPALYASGVSRTPFADRYLYFPSIGFALLAALFLKGFISRPGASVALKRWAAALFIVTAASYSAWASERSSYWKNDYALWSRSLEGSPENYIAMYCLGTVDFQEGRTALAIERLEKAIELNKKNPHPDWTMVLLSRRGLAGAYFKAGSLDKAISEYVEVLKAAPEDAGAAFYLGSAYLEKGNADDAIEVFKHALLFAEGPLLKDIYNGIGGSYMKKGQIEEAAANYREALKIDPSDIAIIQNLKKAYGGQ